MPKSIKNDSKTATHSEAQWQYLTLHLFFVSQDDKISRKGPIRSMDFFIKGTMVVSNMLLEHEKSF